MILRKAFISLLTVTALSVTVGQSYAQEVETIEKETEEVVVIKTRSFSELKELDTWVTKYLQWREWNNVWFNKVSRDNFNKAISAKRKKKPVPPTWLGEDCSNSFLVVDKLIEACDLLKEYSEDYETRSIRQQMNAAAFVKDKRPKTSFSERIHLDLYSPIADSKMYKYGGIFGVHFTLPGLGRVEPFGAPGFVLLSLPSLRGRRELKTGINYGISIRLFSFQPPVLVERRTVLHFTMAKVWVTSISNSRLNFSQTYTTTGISLTFRKNN